MINIRGNTEIVDVAYRYKMPRIETKIEGRGNGIKTVLPNALDVAGALNRNASELTKFMGCELGAQTIMNEADNRYIVNGAHEMRDIQELVFKYCEIFVLCPNCHLPETVIKIRRGDIFQKCAACGAKELVDMTHRLTTFIINQNKKTSKGSGKRKERRNRDAANGDDAPLPEDASPKKEKKAKKDKKKKKKKKKDRNGEGDDEEGDGDGAEADIAEEATGEDDGDADGDDDDEGDEEGSEDPVDAFQNSVNECAGFIRAWLTEHEDADADAIVAQLTVIQMSEANIDTQDKLLVLLTALLVSTSWPAEFSPQLVLAWSKQQLEPREEVLQKLCGSDFMKRYFIGAIEHLCVVRQPLLQPHFPVILKVALEDLEVVEEEDIMGWAREPFSEDTTPCGVDEDAHDRLTVLAQPLIEWLEAEESDEDEDGED